MISTNSDHQRNFESTSKLKQKPSGNYFIPWILKQLWQMLQAADQSELKIRQHQDRSGQVYWHVYDPFTNRAQQFDSEETLRIWLDNRYSR